MLHSFGKFQTATWNFTESGHGKGAADGICGSLKRQADALVAHGQDITSASVLFSALLGAKTLTKLYMTAEDDISIIDGQFDTSAVKTIKGTMKLHQLTWSKARPQHLTLRYLSCLSCPPDKICEHYNCGGMVSMNVKYIERSAPVEPARHQIPSIHRFSEPVDTSLSLELPEPVCTTSQSFSSQTLTESVATGLSLEPPEPVSATCQIPSSQRLSEHIATTLSLEPPEPVCAMSQSSSSQTLTESIDSGLSLEPPEPVPATCQAQMATHAHANMSTSILIYVPNVVLCYSIYIF